MTHLVRERVDGDTEGSRKTEVTQLQLSLAVDEKILGLKVSVEDPVFVAERGAFQELVHEAADGVGVECATIAMCIHVLLKIALAVFENEDKLGLGVYDIVEPDDVDVLELLHEGDLADGGRWRAFFRIKMNLLESNDLVCCPRAAL